MRKRADAEAGSLGAAGPHTDSPSPPGRARCPTCGDTGHSWVVCDGGPARIGCGCRAARPPRERFLLLKLAGIATCMGYVVFRIM